MEGGSGERLRREEGSEVAEEKGGGKICGGKKVMVFVFIYVASYYILM